MVDRRDHPEAKRARQLTEPRNLIDTAETQRVHKTLEDAGIKLDSVAA
jgi:hypothetical protein